MLKHGIHTKPSNSVLVVLSGGQDSTTCLYAAMRTRKSYSNQFGFQVPNVKAIAFNYGQKHSVELECAKKIAGDAYVELEIIDLSFFGHMSISALTDHDANINAEHPFLKGRPASFVPNRNALFLTLAHAYAQTHGLDEVWTGVCETDYSGYPDCRHDFIQGLFRALNEGAESNIRAVTPLMFLNKAETFKLAAECNGLQAVIHDSHTCYNGDREHLHGWGYGCASCPACKLRQAGWEAYCEMGLNPR